MKIALVGNPNSGKTTLFNFLTGNKEKIGNWAGVTVSYKYGQLKKSLCNNLNIEIIDLPGVYSLSPFTKEEVITRKFLTEKKPDLIVNIIDSTSLNRSLYLTTELLELNIPIILVLNKSDLLKKHNIYINTELLSKLIGYPVVNTISTSDNKELLNIITNLNNIPKFNSNVSLPNNLENKKKRYDFVNKLTSNVQITNNSKNLNSFQNKLDKILTNKFIGIPIFIIIMWFVFALSQKYIGPFISDALTNGIESFKNLLNDLLGTNVAPILKSILLDGIVGGVGAVIGFLPLLLILFFLISLLEDSGYMARIAVIMDNLFRKIGLDGKSIIPIIIGTGCSVPGIMATRTIKNERQRKTTILLTPFIPCGAKLPVIALFTTIFFNNSPIITTLMYFLSILVIIVTSLITTKILGEKEENTYFIIELPEYKLPNIKNSLSSTIEKGKSFIIRASTIILLCNTIVYVIQSFDFRLNVVPPNSNNSILAVISTPFSFLLLPLGFGIWQLTAAFVTGFIAKENIIGTLATLYSVTSFINLDDFTLINEASKISSTINIAPIAAISYLSFNLFSPPCFAAISTMKSELKDKKWFFGALGLQFTISYTISFLIYQIGTLLLNKRLGDGFILGVFIIILLISIVYFLIHNIKKSMKGI